MDQQLDELAADVVAIRNRAVVCDVVSAELGRTGRRLRSDDARHEFRSPDPQGNGPTHHQLHGLATIATIGGELGRGATALLREDNLYGAGALIRQLVEVEFLAQGFASDHRVAVSWLAAGRRERAAFWHPHGGGRAVGNPPFAEDYDFHCDVGGFPTTKAVRLLPGPARMRPAEVWVDLAGHLDSTRQHVVVSIERWVTDAGTEAWRSAEVSQAIDEWRRTDGLLAGLRDVAAMRHRDTSLK